MKSRMFVVAVMTAVLSMPAAALATDQGVDVQVLPTDVLGITVHHPLNFNIEILESAVQQFGMDITNTQDGGWSVTVDGPALETYTPGSAICDETGCHDHAFTGTTIAKSNVVVTGGDTCWSGMECDPVADTMITSSSVALGGTEAIMVGTAEAHGIIGFQYPYMPKVEVTIPDGSAPGSYFTTLTYTIMPAP